MCIIYGDPCQESFKSIDTTFYSKSAAAERVSLALWLGLLLALLASCFYSQFSRKLSSVGVSCHCTVIEMLATRPESTKQKCIRCFSVFL